MQLNSVLFIGDKLIRPKFFGIVPHEGVLVGSDAVLHNTPDRGEHLSSLLDFAAGETVRVLRTFASPALVIGRAREILRSPRRYDPIVNNCQHTVAKVVAGKGSSPVVFLAVAIAILSGILILASALRRS